MRFTCILLGFLCCFQGQLRSEVSEIAADGLISENGSQIHLSGVEEQDTRSMASYIQGALDAKFPSSAVTVDIRNGVAFLSNLPQDPEASKAIVTYTRDLTSKPLCTKRTPRPTSEGIWFPESTILFPTQVANPRQIAYSCALRVSDRIAGHWSGPVSFADSFPMYRWTNIWNGDLQLELEGGVFSVFNLSKGHFPQLNTDFYVALPLSFKTGDWRWRVRPYHISSHLGDEYMRYHHTWHRKNKSFEALDASCAYYILPELYVFGTLGCVPAADDEYLVGKAYVEYGFEARGEKQTYEQLFVQPFLSVFCRNSDENNFHTDLTMAVGYEWGKMTNVGRLVRAFVEYHQGYSQEGQFTRKKTNYLELKLSYGF